MFFKQTTALPMFFPVPQFMLSGEHSVNATLLYALLLYRTQLSQRSGWVDEQGRVYVVYPIRQLADDLNRSERTVKIALNELENAGLLKRVRQGFTKANRLYLLLPDDVQKTAPQEVQKTEPQEVQEAAPQEVQDSTLQEVQNLPPNKKEKKKIKELKEGERSARRPFGQFQNVFLSEDEYAALQADHPYRCEGYIDRLSRYMAADGRHYANHYAVLLKWLDEDARSKPKLPQYVRDARYSL